VNPIPVDDKISPADVSDHDAFIKQYSEGELPVWCPFADCERKEELGTRLAVIQHFGRGHHIHTASYKAPRNNKKSKKGAKKESTPVVHNEPKGDLLATGGMVGVDALLAMIFPEGIPPHKIPAVVAWIDASRALVP
jgi:hypothetical protein